MVVSSSMSPHQNHPSSNRVSDLMDTRAENARTASVKILELSSEYQALDSRHELLKEEYSKLLVNTPPPVPTTPPAPVLQTIGSAVNFTATPQQLEQCRANLVSFKERESSLIQPQHSPISSHEVLQRVKLESYSEQKELRHDISQLKGSLASCSNELSASRRISDEQTMKIANLEEKNKKLTQNVADLAKETLVVPELRELVRERGDTILSLTHSLEAAEEQTAIHRNKTSELQDRIMQLTADMRIATNEVHKVRSDHLEAISQCKDDYKKKVRGVEDSNKEKQKEDMTALLTMQGNALEQDSILSKIKNELTAVRIRYDAVSKEKDLLMQKLVNERSSHDGIPVIPRKKLIYVTENASCQTEEEKHVGTALTPPTPLSPKNINCHSALDMSSPLRVEDATIDHIKRRISEETRDVTMLHGALRSKSVEVSRLRDALQERLRDEMTQLTRDRDRDSDLIFQRVSEDGSNNTNRNINFRSLGNSTEGGAAPSLSPELSSKSSLWPASISHSSQILSSSSVSRSEDSVSRKLDHRFRTTPCRGQTDIMIRNTNRKYNSTPTRCPTVSPVDAAPLMALIGEGLLHLPGNRPL